jgi:hypothetical protein
MDLNKIMAQVYQAPEVMDLDTEIQNDDDLGLVTGMGDLDGPCVSGESPFDDAPQIASPVAEADMVRRTAKILLMRGFTGADFINTFKRTVGSFLMRKHKGVLASVLRNEGIVGKIAVDSDGFKDCREALAFARKMSPQKRYIKYAILNPNCPGCAEAMSKEVKRQRASVGGGTIDAFFSGGEESETVSHPVCSLSNLRIISAYDELQDDDVDPTLIDLMTIGDITKDDMKAIKASKDPAIYKARHAFILIDRRRRGAGKGLYQGSVDTSGYKIDAKVTVDIAEGLPKSMREAINIEDVATNRGKMDLDFAGRKEAASIEAKSLSPKTGIKITNIAKSGKPSIKMEVPAFAQDEFFVKGKASLDDSPQIDMEFDEGQDVSVSEAQASINPDFKGSSKMDLKAKPAPKPPLDIDHRASLDL